MDTLSRLALPGYHPNPARMPPLGTRRRVNKPWNGHLHPRDDDLVCDGRSEMLVPLFADHYYGGVFVGNTYPAITTPLISLQKKATWQALIPPSSRFEIRIAALLTEETTPEMIIAGYDQPDGQQAFDVMKMYLKSVSNATGHDVDNIDKVIPCIHAMTYTKWQHQREPMRLMIHAERKWDFAGARIGILDREFHAMQRDIMRILAKVPDAILIICHVSDKRTIEFIRYLRSLGYWVYGEIAPQYAIWCLDDLFEDSKGGTALNGPIFNVPCFKQEDSRVVVLETMLSGDPGFFFASDDACHGDNENSNRLRGFKIVDGRVIGGGTQLPEAVVSFVLECFEEAGKIEMADNFLSHFGRDAHGLPRYDMPEWYERYDWTVQDRIERTSPLLGYIRSKLAMVGMPRRFKRILQAA